MRHLALALAALLVIGTPAGAQQVRDLANVNGWRAYVAQGDGGRCAAWAPMRTASAASSGSRWSACAATCMASSRSVTALERPPGRHRAHRGRDRRRPAELNYIGTTRQDMIEASYQGAFDNFLNFVRAFAAGNRMQVSFPGERVAPWSANLRGTRAVTDAFLACARRL